MKEAWAPVAGYLGIYLVSNMGKVRSRHSGEWKVLNGYDDGKGYVKVDLFLKGRKRKFFVHRLVAKSFIENPRKFKQVNHINHKPSDNRLSNLEWCNQSHNTREWHRLKKPKKTHCKNGHPFSGDNLIIKHRKGSNVRCCRKCMKQWRINGANKPTPQGDVVE